MAQALEDYLAAAAAGTAPPREEFLARHPELAEDLDACLAALHFIGRAAEGPRSVAAQVVEPHAPELTAGVLGDFRIVREVGRGGMGVVYEAEQVSLGRRVALKVLPFAATMDPRQLQRFHNEARAAASLDHPHIVHVHAVGCERGVHYYAMQFIEGQTLAALIADLRQRSGRPAPTEEQPTTPHRPGQPAPAADTASRAAASTERTRLDRAHYRRVAELGVQAAEALDHAHALGIVHRDVKPANLLVDARGGLWVTDFGLAHIQSDARLTMTGDLVGTLRYMSPEQALAKRVVVDHRTDVYSLGATLYELLTLEPAFTGNDRQDLLRQIAFEEPRPPRRVNRTIPAELETIVLKAMEKNPAERYATARELADDLRRYLADEPIRARPAGAGRRLRKWGRRHRAAVVASVVVLALALMMLSGAGGWLIQARAAAEDKAGEALEAAAPGLREGNPWDPALVSAAQRAEAQLDSGLLSSQSRRRVQQLQKDVKMLAELERIRLEQCNLADAFFDAGNWDPKYSPVFHAYGIDMGAAGLEEATAILQRSAICEHLVAGLDNWASGLVLLRKEDARAKAKRLLAVARQVDPDPWRNRMRDMVQSEDASDIEQLVRAAPVEELPRATLELLGIRVWMATHCSGVRVSGQPLTVSQPIVEVLWRAQRRFPADPWLNLNLAVALGRLRPPRRAEAIGFHRAAMSLRPQSALTHHHLAYALHEQGDLDEAIIEYRKALELDPEDAGAHFRFGNALLAKGDVDGAIAAFRTAIALKLDFPEAHCNLGNALSDKEDLDGTIAEYREALAAKQPFPEAYNAHNGLGLALGSKGDVDEAIAEFRKAIELAPDRSVFHSNLGMALGAKGDVDGAMAEYRKAIELDPRSALPHLYRGNDLCDAGNVGGGIADYRKAIDLDPKDPQAHGALGRALMQQGQFAEALAATRRCLELLPQRSRSRQTVSRQLQQCERLVELDGKLPAILSGKEQPASAAERAEYAEVCCRKRLYAAAALLSREAIAAKPDLVASPANWIRYNAACAAALAGCGAGEDASKLTDAERTAHRKQALDWLRADLDAWRGLLDKERPAVAEQLQHWLRDPDFNGVRGPEALAKLPEAEREGWQKLWADVADLLHRAADKPPQPTGGDKKP
jgi:serine/threonine protein kinase/Flp pilus assembly protein TadD